MVGVSDDSLADVTLLKVFCHRLSIAASIWLNTDVTAAGVAVTASMARRIPTSREYSEWKGPWGPKVAS